MNNPQAMEWFEVYRKASAASEDGVVSDQDALACLQRALDSHDPGVYYSYYKLIGDGCSWEGGEMPRAVDYLKQAAELGHPKAMKEIASWYYYNDLPGVEIKADYKKAMDYVVASEQAGERFNDLDEFLPLDVDLGRFMIDEDNIAWWEAVEAKRPRRNGRYALAEYYFDNANGDARMIAKAQDLLRKSAEEGCPNAECLLAEKLLNMGGDDNLAEARKWMVRAEEHGEDVDELAPRLGVKSSRILELERLSETDDDATAELAVAYMRGEGCVRDLEHAYELASRIAYESSFARFFNSVNSDDPDEAAIVKRIGDEIADFERAHPELNDSTDPDEDNRRKPSDDWMFPNEHDDGESIE